MELSEIRLHELLAVVAERFPTGVTCEDFKSAAFPRSKSSRGARHVLAALVARGLLRTVGAKYELTELGWLTHREPGNGAELDEPEPDVEPIDDDEITLDDLRACDVPIPAPPSGQWLRAADGRTWLLEGPDGFWWSQAGNQAPRTQGRSGYWFALIDGRRVVLLRCDRWGREINRDGSLVHAAPGPSMAQQPQPSQFQQPAPGLGHGQAPQPLWQAGWFQTPAGMRWFDGQMWVEPDGRRHAPGGP